MKKNTTTRKPKEATINDVLNAIGQLGKKFNDGFDRIDERFKKVDQRFEEIDQRFSLIDKRFLDLESRMDSRFVDFEDRMNKRFLDFEVKMDSRFVDLEQRMNHKFDLMENQIDSLAKQTKDIYDEQRSLVSLYTHLYDKVETHDRVIVSLKSARA